MTKLVAHSRVLAAAAALLTACVSTPDGSHPPVPPPATAAAVPAPTSTSVPPAESKAAKPGALEPPDGKWLTDENGDQYFIVEVPRYEGEYVWVDEHTVRLRHGMPLKLASYDDTTFYAKVFKVDDNARRFRRRTAPTAEDLERVAATYVVEIPAGGSLHLLPFESGLPQRGQWRNGFAVADMNEDGHPDVVHSPSRKGLGRPVIFLGDGKGSWRPWATRFPPLSYDYGDARVADFNRDGHADLALAMHILGTVVLVGDGTGGFMPWSEGIDYNADAGRGTGYSTRSLEVLDWNGDGLTDVLTLGEGMSLATTAEGGAQARAASSHGAVVYLNRGEGRWERRDQGTGVDQLYGDVIALGDFDGDGSTDFAVSSSVFSRRDVVSLHQADGSWKSVEVPLRDRGFLHFVAAADFDGDRRTDLAVSYQTNEFGVDRAGIDVYLSRPAEAGVRWERRPLAVREGRGGWSTLAAGDVDGDGAPDLLAMSFLSEVELFRGDGQGGFSRLAAEPAKLTQDCRAFRARISDLDGDGKPELVADFAGEASSAQDTLLKALKGSAPSHCPGEGAIRAFQVSVETTAVAKP